MEKELEELGKQIIILQEKFLILKDKVRETKSNATNFLAGSSGEYGETKHSDK